MSPTIAESAFAEIFRSDTPLLDVRAPVEFEHGTFPQSVNFPLLTDDEREQIGKTYKQHGQQEAISLGNRLISGKEKQQRIESWQNFIAANPGTLLYCFRGGLRSQTVKQWLEESGVQIPLIEGGYKALRSFLIKTTEESSARNDFIIIGGKTGSAKTHLLNKLNLKIDLEGLARHRGSAFGRRIKPQPVQIDFENQLAIALLKLPSARNKTFLEDESRAIGSLSIPLNFHRRMSQSPIAMVEESLKFRTNTILNDYIISNFRDFETSNPSNAYQLFEEFLLGSLQRIQKRLGGDRHQKIKTLMEEALKVQRSSGESEQHRSWISLLLEEYYDPMYEYQMNKKLDRVVYRGNSEEFLQWASHIDSQSINKNINKQTD